MEYLEFLRATMSALPQDKIVPNPLSGTTRIVKYSGDTLVFQRRNSKFYVSLRVLHRILNHFEGGDVSSRDLRRYAPEIFDSRKGGHSCNCTMLFIISVATGIADTIEGRGQAGDPFYITI